MKNRHHTGLEPKRQNTPQIKRNQQPKTVQLLSAGDRGKKPVKISLRREGKKGEIDMSDEA